VGLSQLAAQAVIFLGEVSDPTIFGSGEVDLASTLLRFQRGALGCGTLLAPGVQMGGVNPFLAQQSADFARLSAAIRSLQNAALFAAGNLPTPACGGHLRVGPRGRGRVSSRPTGIFQRPL
jgi:hypothetical protein